MRDGLVVSVFGHAVLLAWGLLSLPAPQPLDAGAVESIPVNFVKIADVTSVPKGIDTPKRVEKPKPEPAPQPLEQPKPKPEPTPPPPPPEPKPPAPAPVAPPAPTPPAPTPPKPEPPPEKPAPEPAPPPEPAPKAEPAPKPEPAVKPEPAAKPEPPPPEKPPAPEPPAPEAPKTEAKPAATPPVPLPRPRMLAQATPPSEQKQTDTFNADKIAALLNKDTAAPQPQAEQPTLGGSTPAEQPQMTANELDALRARLGQCWSPPIGWTDAAEVRVVVLLSLNPDGTVNGEPQVLERPSGRYEQAAPESVLRAVRRCAPYTLPPEKYDEWKQIRITFDPTEMGGN